ncbi:MAG: DUF3352 domain-containing protein [Planctomycetes bacterium]|nr:DUF3352 domain-containing protein [Planctomycetota bacterium]
MNDGVCRLLLALLVFVAGLPAPRGEEAPEAGLEAMLPAKTLAGLLVSDVETALKEAKAGRLGRMIAQPELQAYFAPIFANMKAVYEDLRAGHPELLSVEDLERSVLRGSACAAVYKRDAGEALGFLAVVKPGDPATLARVLPPNMTVHAGRNSVVAWRDGCLIYGKPAEDLKGILAAKPGAVKLGVLRARLDAKEVLAWADVAAIYEQMADAQDDETSMRMRAVLGGLGLFQVKRVRMGLGFHAGEAVLETCLDWRDAVDAKALQGVFRLFEPGEPFAAGAFKIAGPDAPYVGAGYFHWDRLQPLVLDLVARQDPARAAEVAGFLKQVDTALGFDLQKDLLANLGGAYVLAESSIDTSVPFSSMPGLVFSFPAKDPAKVEACLQKFHAWFTARIGELGSGIGGFVLRKYAQGDRTIYALTGKLLGGPLVAWSVSDGRMLVGTTVNALRRGMEQLGRTDSILDNPEFAKTVARLAGKPFDAKNLPQGLAYGSDRSTGLGTFALSSLGVASGTIALSAIVESAQKRARGPRPHTGEDRALAFLAGPAGQALLKVANTVDVELWPDATFFERYRVARGSLSRWDPEGLFVRCELPFPVPGASAGNGSPSALTTVSVAAVGAGLLLPVLARARESARRSSSMSNLSQMGKAMAMYSMDQGRQGKFPPTAADLYPDYVRDARVFLRPGWSQLHPAHYMYIPGSEQEDGITVVAFENPPEDQFGDGRNVLVAAGSVEWMSNDEFANALRETAAVLMKKGIEMKPVPIVYEEIIRKK